VFVSIRRERRICGLMACIFRHETRRVRRCDVKHRNWDYGLTAERNFGGFVHRWGTARPPGVLLFDAVAASAASCVRRVILVLRMSESVRYVLRRSLVENESAILFQQCVT